MTKTIVIHHSADFDGLFCREIARKFLPDATLIGWDYGDPKLDFPDDGTVYILDLSPECFNLTTDNLTMRKDGGFDGNSHRTIWIDHHKSAIEKFPRHIPGYRIDGVAACRLAWQWFTNIGPDNPSWDCTLAKKQDFIERKVSEPLAVRLAGEYDIWDKRDPDAEIFQHGLRSQELKEQTWKMLLDDSVDSALEGTGMEIDNSTLICRSLINQGRCLQYAKTQENAAIIKRQGHDVEWEGLKFLACNHAMFNSHLFTAGIKPEHDALMGFRWDGKEWNVSLYHAPGKEHHDLSLIAVKYGGGGHKGACGFRLNTLPFAHGL